MRKFECDTLFDEGFSNFNFLTQNVEWYGKKEIVIEEIESCTSKPNTVEGGVLNTADRLVNVANNGLQPINLDNCPF